MLFYIVGIAIYDTALNGNSADLLSYWDSLTRAPAVALGVLDPGNYSALALSIIATIRFLSIGLLATLFVKRFGRR